MFRRIVTVMCVLAASVATASAQSKVEISGSVGWTFSDGVSGTPVISGDGNVYDRIDPKDSVSYGFTAGFLVTHNAEVGFMYGVQTSKLLLSGTNEREIGDLSVSTYHGYFAYNFGEEDAPLRPFVFFGLGATSFSSVDTVILGQNRTINGESQFSSTLGGGAKFYFSKHVGARAAIKLTPTYIKSDAAGWWCDPFWGCYLVGDPQYSNQFEISGGVTVRF
jgi:outer membrane protein W